MLLSTGTRRKSHAADPGVLADRELRQRFGALGDTPAPFTESRPECRDIALGAVLHVAQLNSETRGAVP